MTKTSPPLNPKPNFKARKKAREYVLQALYGYLLTQNSINDIEYFILTEHAKENFDKEYFLELLHEIPKNLEKIEAAFLPYLDRKFSDLDYIEVTILRIASFELMQRLDVPYRVVINEALELAKKFGAKESFKYINGVLDKVAPHLRPMEAAGKI